jgi:hypothetical protein
LSTASVAGERDAHLRVPLVRATDRLTGQTAPGRAVMRRMTDTPDARESPGSDAREIPARLPLGCYLMSLRSIWRIAIHRQTAKNATR